MNTAAYWSLEKDSDPEDPAASREPFFENGSPTTILTSYILYSVISKKF